MHDKEKEQLMSSAGFLDGHAYLVISISRVSNIIWTSVHMPNPNLYTYTMIGKFLACQLLWFYHEFHDFSASLTVSQPHKLISRAVHFCYVNIYRCRSNGASDTDFLSPGKNAVWCWEQSPNFAYCKRGWHIHETKPHTHKLCKRRLVTPG